MERRVVVFKNAPRLVSLDEAAGILGVSTRTIRRRIKDGTFTEYRTGPRASTVYRTGPRAIQVDLNEIERSLSVVPTGGAA